MIVGDVLNTADIIHTLEGVDGIVICLSAMTSKLIRKMRQIERDAVLEIMKQAKIFGIKRLVYMSGYELRTDVLKKLKIEKFGDIKIEMEEYIKQSDFNWTILGDAPSFDLFFAFYKNGKMMVPGGGYKSVPAISAVDVGEITAQAVLRNDLDKQRLKLTGPTAYTFPEVAKLISEIIGKKVVHKKIPLAIICFVSIILLPFNPFPRYLYQALKMFNNFPEDLATKVPQDHHLLRQLFDYEPITLEMEIKKRLLS